MTTTAPLPMKEASSTTTNTLGSRAFWLFGVLVFLLFVTESVFFVVASQLPDDRLPELRDPPVGTSTPAPASRAEATSRSDETP